MLVFYHIPKTAGTSSRRVIEAWFPTIYRDYDYRSAPLDASADTSSVCLIGHFAGRLLGHELALLDLLPSLKGPNPETLFTVLREPLDHAVSAYYHMRDIDKDRLGSLAEFLENGHPFQTSVVLGIPDSDCISPALDSFAVVGDTSDLQKTFDVLADQLEKPRLKVPTVRVGTRDAQVITLNASERSRFEKMWPLDFEIYEVARDRLRLGKTAASSEQRQYFPHADKTSAFTNAALKRQNDVRYEWSMRPESANDDAPALPPEFRLLVDKKDARIQELELKIANVEDRSRSLLEKLAEQTEKHLGERTQLIAKLHSAQTTSVSLKDSIEKQQHKIKIYREQIEVLKLQGVNDATIPTGASRISTCTTATSESNLRGAAKVSAAVAESAVQDVQPQRANASALLAVGADTKQAVAVVADGQPKADFVGSISDLKTILAEINSMLTELNAK